MNVWRKAIPGNAVLLGTVYCAGTRRIMSLTLRLLVIAAFVVPLAATDVYDPLQEPSSPAPVELRLQVSHPKDQRKLPLRLLLPSDPGPRPVVLFSHGLGGSCEGNDHLAHWTARGYVLVYLQHPGSDVSVWQDVPRAQAILALRRAANAENFHLRVADVRVVLDALHAWHATPGHALAGRLDLTRIGMSGHSFGALTTQAVAGQDYAGLSLADPRIRAAIAFSPSPPRQGDAEQAFAHVTVPWLLMTGTDDEASIAGVTAADRLRVFPALPPGAAYELVLDRAEHSAFTDRALPGDRQDRNPNHHRAIQALSTAFWDAYLGADDQARAWLDGEGPRSVLEAGDRWQRK